MGITFMDFAHGLLLLCTLLGFYNLGITWFGQIVVYPLFAKVGAEEYITYHTYYSRQIPLPVILPGFANFLLPIALIFYHPESVSLEIALANAACGLLSLVVTVALEIPRHDRLEKGGKQEEVIQELIRYNWPRTFSIMGSAFLTLMMLMQAFSPTV
ncbi:hypothetical protein [Leptolyngbya sp. FACHB-541]|uniref:hypothetical protein n=1 Tax=Leptolyngbya sp. FACHB-541 TaxID=2692810 RepID=UPI0018EFE6BE|nr:hypothetical protein [Leptolyngbya sp. FACHB-541]